MSTRRNLLTKALILAGATSSAGEPAEQSATRSSSSGSVRPQNAAEAASSRASANEEYAVGDVRRYGIIANDRGAATTNSQALRALVAPTGTFTGSIYFPSAGGADTYYFDDVIAFHDDIHVDLQGSTLEFAKEAAAADANSGFIFAVRNFSIQNGSIVVKYKMSAVASSAGSAIHIGNRGTDSIYFSPAFDSLLKSPMGNITIRNMRITSNVTNGNAIEMTGGLSGVVIENVFIEGQSSLSGGLYYEFGWATPGTTNLRQTSHAHNLRFSNINVKGLQKHVGAAVTLAGAYNCSIDGLYVNGALAVFNGTSGESLFYRPWLGVDEIGAKRTIALRNIVAADIAGTAITFGGSQRSANGYLAAHKLTAAAQTDLGDYVLEGFTLEGSANGWGIYTSANRADIREGRIVGFQRGIVQSDDCTRLLVNVVDVFDCAQFGLQLNIGAAIWDPPRKKMGEIRNCFIAGNSKERAGIFPAIALDNCAGFLIENNRIGYDLGHDGKSETTQGAAVLLGADCANVLCRANYVAGLHGEGVAYSSVRSDDAHGNAIQSAGGIVTSHGSWAGTTIKRRVVDFAPVITISASGSDIFNITATSNINFVMKAPVNPVNDKIITVTVRNASGGALGKVTWDPIFRLSPWANPANGYSRSITLCFDGKHWLQIMQGAMDVPN